MSTIKLSIASRSGSKKQPGTIDVSLPSTATTEELHKHVAAKAKLNVNRVRITTQDKKVVVDNDTRKTLAQAGLQQGDKLVWKDLGPQISWKVVFLIEYFGPLFIHPLFYFYGHEIVYQYLPKGWNTYMPVRHSKMQTMALCMTLGHYVKRELETLFVHRFSNATMPFFNVFKNSAHYWGLSGVLLAIPLYGPWYGAGKFRRNVNLRGTDEYLWPVLSVWLTMEVCNFACHVILRWLRPASDPKKRQIPEGFAFNKISCPNYFFESLSWLAFTALTMDPFAAIFWAVGTAQMMVWAKQKHRRYKKEFGDKYPKRWMMFPGFY